MSKTLHVDPGDAAPIWRQIEQGVRRLVASGALRPGSPVPSVRDLSQELRVNPATVAKAYQRLTQAGVLAMRRGEGTFVADSPPALEEGDRRRELREGAMRYASLAKTSGAGRREAAEALRAAWDELEGASGGAKDE